MKVSVITGSPHKNGTSALLADRFIEGAEASGHDVSRFDAAFETVKPCLACEYCSSHNTECIHNDSMEALYGKLLESEVVVLVTPLYYYTMSTQIKAVLDRFHAKNVELSGNKKAILMAAAYGDDRTTMVGLEKTYESILVFLNWENVGTILATGCPTREVLEQTQFPQHAYEMGRNL